MTTPTRSSVCRAADFLEPWFCRLAATLGIDNPTLPFERRNVHRKVWEWVAIAHTAGSLGLLHGGASALGFAVGRERLPAYFASLGVHVTATDVGSKEISAKWEQSRQHSSGLDDLYYPSLIDRAAFDDRVTFAHADMSDVSTAPAGPYDFVWSACALEHLGSIEAGARFVVESTKLLKPGGVALHTTEYNLSSIDETVTKGDTVLFRKIDLERLGGHLRKAGAGLAELDLDPGTHEYDLKYDVFPFHEGQRKHLKLQLMGHVCTSVLLVVHA